MDQFDLQGIVAATFTPMKANGDVNLSLIGKYVTYLVENHGVTSIFVNGTTGEGESLSVAERKKLLEAWLSAGRDRLKHVIVNIGCSSITDCKELAKHAEQVGASAVAITTPSYFRPSTPGSFITLSH
uniref:N-acetylneuraminate lyase-like isoform X2 n=1 Tax=Myxine glutinosa TaxID=7769 RepID=UPI00358E5434